MTPDVALVSPYPTNDRPGQSGVAWYSRCLAHALADAGAHVTVVAPGERGSYRIEKDGPVQVDRCFHRGPAGVLKAVGGAFATGSPVVHVQHEAFLYGGPETVPSVLAALARIRQAGRGPVVTMHQVVEPSAVGRAFTEIHRVNIPPPVARAGLAAMQTSVARTASRVIVHEEAFRKVLTDAVVFPLGGNVAPGPADVLAAGAARMRAAAGAGADALLVLCFGFVAPYKGFEAALEAAALAGPAVKMVVAGGEHPRLEGQGYLDGLRRRYGGVAHFTGFVPDDQVGAWFAAADAVMLPYPQPFSSSGVLADAAAHGVPVLVSGPLAEVIGFPAEAAVPLQPAALAARLRDLAADRSRLEPLAALTATLRQGRSWEELARRHIALYEEVIDAQRSPRRAVRLGSGR